MCVWLCRAYRSVDETCVHHHCSRIFNAVRLIKTEEDTSAKGKRNKKKKKNCVVVSFCETMRKRRETRNVARELRMLLRLLFSLCFVLQTIFLISLCAWYQRRLGFWFEFDHFCRFLCWRRITWWIRMMKIIKSKSEWFLFGGIVTVCKKTMIFCASLFHSFKSHMWHTRVCRNSCFGFEKQGKLFAKVKINNKISVLSVSRSRSAMMCRRWILFAADVLRWMKTGTQTHIETPKDDARSFPSSISPVFNRPCDACQPIANNRLSDRFVVGSTQDAKNSLDAVLSIGKCKIGTIRALIRMLDICVYLYVRVERGFLF